MISKLQRVECNDFYKEIESLNPKKKSLPLTVGETSGESNIANIWKDHFSVIANSVGSTDNPDQVIIGLWTVPGHNDVINAHELRQIMRGLKNKKAVGNDWIPPEVGILDLSNCWPWCQYFFPVEILLVSYWVPLCTYWSYHYWNANLKIQQEQTIKGQLQLPQ